MMLDPTVDPGRRVWLPCTYCGANNPLSLRDSAVNLVWVQCGVCLRRWWLDTGCGRGRPRKHLIDEFDVA